MTHFDFTIHFSCFPSELSIILAVSVNDLAFKRPKPKRWLYWIPAAFRYQPELLSKPSDEDVCATKCCKSRQVRFGLKEKWIHYRAVETREGARGLNRPTHIFPFESPWITTSPLSPFLRPCITGLKSPEGSSFKSCLLELISS